MEYLLCNNMKLIYRKSTSSLTSISISIDAGAGVEREKLGLAHATEHMLYKGTKNRSEGQINKALSEIFGFQNAMTNFPYVIYYGTLLKNDFEEGIELFSDIVINPAFKEEGFKEEMEVIKEELKEWDEEVEQYCEDMLFLNTFENRRIKHPIIGTMESLEKISLEDIKEFYNKFYSPENTSIAVVSSLEFNDVKDIIEKYFGQWSSGHNRFIRNEVIYDFNKANIYENNRAGINTYKIQMIFPIDKLDNEEIKALRVFNEYFGEGVDSALYDILRTKNSLIYDVITKIAYEKYIKLYKITFSTSKENLDESLRLINECIEKISDLKEDNVSFNVKKLVKTLRLKRLFREEQGIILAKELSTYSTMFGDYRIYENEFDNIENLDKDFILKVATKVLKNPSIQVIKY